MSSLTSLTCIPAHHWVLSVLFLLSTLTIVLGQPGTSVPEEFLVTSPSTCLTSIDCATDSFCPRELPTSSQYPTFECQQKLPQGASCISPRRDSECGNGLYCSNIDRMCAPQLSVGANCSRREPRQCLGSPTVNICRVSDLRCGSPPLSGTEGAPCRQFLDCANFAFYCIRTESKCARRLPPGSQCGSRFFRECQGFCAPLANDIVSGVCLPRGNDGAPCRTDEHCDDENLVTGIGAQAGRLDRRLCNVPSGAQGICLRDSLRLKQLGDPCTPMSDRCDARRGLSCQQRPGGPLSQRDFVCVQIAKVEDVRVTRFCTPNTPFSSCISRNGRPSQCRRERLENLSNRFDGLFACMRALEIMPLGSICGQVEYVVCGSNASCESVPGVRRKFLPSIPVKFCVETKQLGEMCGDKFSTKCANGLTCTDGTCQVGSDPPSIPFTHAYVSTECADLPCVPGLVCKSPVSAPLLPPICQFPSKIANPGELCYNTARLRRVCQCLLFSSSLSLRFSGITFHAALFNHD